MYDVTRSRANVKKMREYIVPVAELVLERHNPGDEGGKVYVCGVQFSRVEWAHMMMSGP